MAFPPSVLIAASKVSRVRSDAFSKNSTIWRPSSEWRKSSGLLLTACASSMIAAISPTVRSPMEQRSRPHKRFAASENALSDWMPSALDLAERGGSAVASGFGFITTVLLPMRMFSRRRLADHFCTRKSEAGEDLVESRDCCIDVLPLKNVRRKKSQHSLARAIDDNVLGHHLGSCLGGQIGRVEFQPEHQAHAAHVGDAIVALLERLQLLLEITAHVLNVGEQIGLFHCVDHSDGDRTGQRAPAESSAVHPGCEGTSSLLRAKHRAHWQPIGDRLCQRGDIRKNAVMLIGEPLAGAAHAGLDFISNQQRAGRIGQLTRCREEFLAHWTNAALTLNCLDTDSANIRREFGAEISDIVEANEADARHYRRKRLAILLLVRGSNRADGAAVETLLDRDESRTDVLALRTQDAGVCACQLQRSLPGFGTGVAEEYPVESAHLGQPDSEFRCVLVIVEVRGMQQAFALRKNGGFDRRVCVAERRDPNAAEQVEVVMALLVAQVDTIALYKQNRVAFVRVQEQLLLRCLDRSEFHVDFIHATMTSVPSLTLVVHRSGNR